MPLQPLLIFRANLKVVLQDNRLSIEIKAAEFAISVQLVQQSIDKLHQPYMMLLIRQIPFPVPVGVGNDVRCFCFFHVSITCLL
ncbi:hypothetical protein D3C77_572100 [compost metagenome]